MQLIKHCYGGRKPSRYYLDSRRVSRETYEHAILVNRIDHGQHCGFVTKVLSDKPGSEHIVQCSCLYSGSAA
ncbi:MAG: hypothetical protein ABL907_16495 [Hyphomicrobium sp.]